MDNCCRTVCNRCKPCCLFIVIAILGVLFSIGLGAILGAVFYETLLPILSSLVVFTIVMLVLIVVGLVYSYCQRE